MKEITVFKKLQQQKAGERKKFVPREYVTIKRKVRRGGEPFFACVQLPPVFRKADCFFSF